MIYDCLFDATQWLWDPYGNSIIFHFCIWWFKDAYYQRPCWKMGSKHRIKNAIIYHFRIQCHKLCHDHVLSTLVLHSCPTNPWLPRRPSKKLTSKFKINPNLYSFRTTLGYACLYLINSEQKAVNRFIYFVVFSINIYETQNSS